MLHSISSATLWCPVKSPYCNSSNKRSNKINCLNILYLDIHQLIDNKSYQKIITDSITLYAKLYNRAITARERENENVTLYHNKPFKLGKGAKAQQHAQNKPIK